ncbi:MAG: glycosyltransferase [Saprospiraceae bacterium]
MKILFLTSRFPYPLEKGDKLRAFHQIKVLSSSHEIHLVSILEEDPESGWLEKVAAYTASITTITIKPFERYVSVIKSLFSRRPVQIAWFYSSTIKKNINRICNELKPDHCYCQLTRMAEYAKDLPVKKTLDYMDSFGISMLRRANIVRFPLSLFYRIEGMRMIDYEASVSKKFNNLTIISQQDKNLLKFDGASNIIVVGNGIDQYFTECLISKERIYELVFIGNMSYLPNIECAEYLVNKIMPLLPSHYRLLISGASPDSRVLALTSSKVQVSGWSEDIRESYLSGRVFVAPMWSGTGQQNKILEALSLGIPCVTTAAVNNAIEASPNEEILIAEAPEEFVVAIQTLLTNEQKYEEIMRKGKVFVIQKFDWKQKGNLLSSIFAKT